jgi:hypothetical protein
MPQNIKTASINPDDEPIVLSKSIMDLIYNQKNHKPLLDLYIFYYYTAKWQKTNRPKCSIAYSAKKLKVSSETIKKNKKILINLGLIKNIQQRCPQGRIIGWYVQVNFIWKRENISEFVEENDGSGNIDKTTVEFLPKNDNVSTKSTGLENSLVVKMATNALSANNINALSVNKQTREESLQPHAKAKEDLFTCLPMDLKNNLNEFHREIREKGFLHSLETILKTIIKIQPNCNVNQATEAVILNWTKNKKMYNNDPKFWYTIFYQDIVREYKQKLNKSEETKQIEKEKHKDEEKNKIVRENFEQKFKLFLALSELEKNKWLKRFNNKNLKEIAHIKYKNGEILAGKYIKKTFELNKNILPTFKAFLSINFK